MSYKLEDNRFYADINPAQVTYGTPDSQIGILGRVFIDLGIALATIGATVLTGGTALPAIVPGLIGSATGLITNTSIDIGEGNTNALTIGLDIGLPFATEGLGSLVGVIAKQITLPGRVFDFFTRNVTLDLEAFTGQRQTIANAIKNLKESGWGVKTLTSAQEQSLSASQREIRDGMIATQKSIDTQVATLESAFKSLTDTLDKVTGATRELIAKMLPRLSKVLKYLKDYLKKLKKAITEILNPVNLALTKAKTATKAILKNIKADETDVKVRLRTIRQRYNIRKQSILQNALIAKYNISRVESTWVLGTSLIINDAEDDGTIKDAHLIWWFIPEATKHDGSRGAVPEPLGKRPVAMKNINQSQYDTIMAEASKGRFYLDNVANGKSPTGLFGGDSGINISDLKSNWISKIFKNAVSIIPGYNLLVDIGHSIKQFETLTSKIVSGELGTDYVKQLTNYKSHLHQFGSYLLPKQFNEAANLLYKNQQFDGSAILKSVEGRAQSVQSNLTKDGVVKKVQNY